MPSWEQEARLLRDAGCTYREIAAGVGVNAPRVWTVLNKRDGRSKSMVMKTVYFPPDQLKDIEKRARKEKVPFAEMVRLLIEWGLEA